MVFSDLLEYEGCLAWFNVLLGHSAIIGGNLAGRANYPKPWVGWLFIADHWAVKFCKNGGLVYSAIQYL